MSVALAENPRAVVGGNNPPEPTPYEKALKRIEDLYGEASLWMDGAPVNSAEVCDGIGNLKSLLLEAGKEAEQARKVEAKPFDEGKAEVQKRYNPLAKKVELAVDACRKAQEPWLKKVADELAAKAEVARLEAAEKAQLAQAAIQATDVTNLAGRAEAEALVEDAKIAARVATKAGKATAKAGGATGRATALRSVWSAKVVDPVKAARHYWSVAPDEINAFIQSLADRDVLHDARVIPGVSITEDKVAV